MKKKRKLFTQTGVTTDDKPVLSDVFAMYGTRGVPLEDIISYLHDKGYIISWIDFYRDARKDGMKHKTITSTLRPVLLDVYGVEFTKVVIDRLDKIFIKE